MTKSRVTNVQMPGAAVALAVAALSPVTGQAGEAATLIPATSGLSPENEGPAAIPAASPTLDIEALRAQIRAEERDKAREELSNEIRAASTAIGKGAGANAAPTHTRADYRNMHAADIDPTTLTAPVMTKDGYLCPPAPEAKK